ncbi:hypothetical protein LCGC14_1652310 [marine sediment metagenome]|uniref:Uncharacterized protein n=1 Tax=marine sediment metagenome TaxID=412755 RepID=A0A0F9KC91_9ZZZZ
MKLIEKHNIKYSCGCVHEIALFEGGGFWKATDNNKDCKIHKKS